MMRNAKKSPRQTIWMAVEAGIKGKLLDGELLNDRCPKHKAFNPNAVALSPRRRGA
jgi:hypothetical protein